MRRVLLAVLAATLAGAALVGVPPRLAHAATRVVDPADGSCNASGPVYCTIMQAVNDATSGDTIQIAAGNHEGGLGWVIDMFAEAKDLTFVGAGEGVTFIDGEATRGGIRLFGPATYEISDLTIIGATRAGSGAGLTVNPDVVVSVSDVTIQGATAGVSGAGVLVNQGDLTLTNVTITGNTAQGGFGGGITVLNDSTVTIEASTISDNSASTVGGGIHVSASNVSVDIIGSTISGNSSDNHGAGIYFHSNTSGGLTITSSEVIDNEILDSGTGGGLWVNRAVPLEVTSSLFAGNLALGRGGGIDAGNASAGGLVISNSTFSGNTADGGDGGGVHGRPIIESSTFTGNHATGMGGGIARDEFFAFQIRNSIVAGNTADTSNLECRGGSSLGYNLLQATVVTDCFSSDATSLGMTDPLLGLLDDNGGPTRTHAIDDTSPAYNAANPADPGTGGDACPDVDQRFEPRGADRCDIGAFELGVTDGGLKGTVTRAGSGWAVPGSPVALFDDGFALVAETTTNAAGQYSFESLAPGNYAVRFADGHAPYVSEWWEGAASQGSADLVAVLSGETVEGIDAQLDYSASVLRYAGPNRFATAVDISAKDFPDPSAVTKVFVAVGSNFPDALAGAAAAGAHGSPLLLVNTATIPAVTADELTRLGPDDVIVLGGEAVVSADVATQLAAWGNVTRLAGANRYATAAAISAWAFGDPSPVSEALVATGANFPDALGGGPAATVLGGPVLLVQPGSVPAEIAAELNRLGSLTRITVLGGTAAVSDATMAALPNVSTKERVAGATRYLTAVEVSKHAFPSGAERVYVAVGTNFPDALAGAAAAGAYGAPVLLVPSDTLPAEVAAEITRLGPHTVIILGGTSVVSVAVENALGSLLGV